MKTIYITEAQKKNLTDLLLENEGTNMKRARKYLESKGYSPEQRQQILDSIRTDIPNSRLQQCKFLLGVTRLYMEGQLNNAQNIAAINKTLKYIASDAHVNEYDFNLNGENLDTLVQRFDGVAKDDLQASMNASNARRLTVNNNYTIVPIDSPEEASKYGKYTSWCVTHDKNMYDSYTNNGSGRFYFCLHKGFENEPMVEGDGCPLDNYGLSMIAVSVTMEGEVNTITCRWNHDNGGNDSIMTIEQLEDTLGRNFYQTFKPYTREELHAKGFILFDEVQELLDDGKKPEEIFKYIDAFCEGFALVELNDKINFINTNSQLISNTWFDYGGYFRDGFARVQLNDKCNFINTNGQIISKTWFDYGGYFRDGFACVKLNNQWNFINTNGQIISKTWFGDCYAFYNGFAVVRLNGKWNFINTDGQIISNTWFDGCGIFKNGFARVELNGKTNYINTNGQIISKTWFDHCGNFNYNGVARVKLNGQEHYINTNGQIVESKGKKTIYITEAQKKKIKKAIAAQDQVGGKVNAGVMDAVAHGGGMCESIENGSLETWYRGYNSKYGSNYTHLLWLTDDIDYARVYGNRIEEITLDMSKISPISLYELDDFCDDYYNGPDEEGSENLMSEGYNCYFFYANNDGSYCMCLWDNTPIISRRELSKEEYEKIEGYPGYDMKNYDDIYEGAENDKYELGSENGDISPYYHVNESLDELDLYHGTNADFDKFDEKFYLTGIGEMAYGWGVYLSNSINTAKEYGPGGQIMTVEVPDGKYLDSRRISKSEACKIARAFYKFFLSSEHGQVYKGSEKEFWDYECSCLENVPDGSYLYGTISTFLGSDKEASEWLHSIGYVGLRFPGHNSNTGEKFMNYVIFDANDVKIIKKEQTKLHENNETKEIITLYHGVNRKGLEFNLEKGGFVPRVCSEGGPKAVWLSEKQYDYEFTFAFDFPKSLVEQLSNVDYIFTSKIGFNDFNCRLVKTSISSFLGNTVVETNILDDRISKLQFRYFPDLGITLWKEFKQYPNILETYINPFIEKYQTLSESKKKVVKNDKGEVVPDACDKCGGEVVVQIHGEPVYICKDCGKYFGTVPFTLKENIESEIVNPEDVDLSSFNIKKNLNPKFWKNGVLDSRIRMKLLDIADDFIEFLGVDWAKPEDITMTGSLANFNWDENYSDIDLHIIMDYSDVDERTDFVSNYFYSQKKLWNEEHSDITIMGFPVEVFVQDVNERHDSSGVYSLEKNKWLIEPEREKLASSKVNKAFIKDKVSEYMNKIDKLEYLLNKSKDDEYRLRRVMEKSDNLFDKIKGERKIGFERSGGKEINNYNIVFKALRRNGYIEKLVNIKSIAYDKLNSLR